MDVDRQHLSERIWGGSAHVIREPLRFEMAWIIGCESNLLRQSLFRWLPRDGCLIEASLV